MSYAAGELPSPTSVSSRLLQAPVAARSTSRALYAAPSASPENMRRGGRPCKHPGQLHLPAELSIRKALSKDRTAQGGAGL